MYKHFFILLLIAISSCVPVYVPMRHNVPMHTGKNEFQGSASVIQGLNIQAAYSISNHLGVTTSYLYANNKDKDSDQFRTQSAGEIGIGYYNHYKENWWVEMYAGYGFGNATAFGSDYFLFSGDEYSISGKYQKFFIQPSIGFRGDNLISNFSIKYSIVNFTELNFLIDGIDESPSIKPKGFFAPVATIKFPVHDKHLYGTLQVGYNIAMGNKPAFDYEPFMLSVGLLYELKPKK